MADHTDVSKSTVQRWFAMYGVQPHRQQYFKLSNDPFFIENVAFHAHGCGALPRQRCPGLCASAR